MERCRICDDEYTFRGVDPRDNKDLPCDKCDDVITSTVAIFDEHDSVLDPDSFIGGVEDFS